MLHILSNGQVENSNKEIIKGLRRDLKESKTTTRRATNDTPFRLAYGTDVLVHVEVRLPSYINQIFVLKKNEEGLRENLDLDGELTEIATSHNAAYQQKVAQHFDSGVCKRLFQVGEYVLIETTSSKHDQLGKLTPN
ncbi:hypothetical protein AgCh_012773 [Apium graveolens]